MITQETYVVDKRERLSPAEFYHDYVGRKPVLMKNALSGSSALRLWTVPYLKEQVGNRRVQLKELYHETIETKRQPFSIYADELLDYEARSDEAQANTPVPAYLHDVPLTSIISDPAAALETFPESYFPAWYGAQWFKYAQLFLGPRNSLTPLHFDCLLTHNLFFQVLGAKRFTLLPPSQLSFCYPHHWRWCSVDVEAPDLTRHPKYGAATPVDVIVEAGDILYFPPGTLHHVRSLSCALSFNVDWHTKTSALNGLAAALHGMPLQNVYYNAIVAAGLCLGIPEQRLFPLYAAYLNYVS